MAKAKTKSEGVAKSGMRPSIGAFWQKTSKTGILYLQGFVTIEGKKIPVVAFENGGSEEDSKIPKFRILKHEPLPIKA